MQYLTGISFHLSERPIAAIFPVNGTAAMILPVLEKAKVHNLSFETRVFAYEDTTGPAHAFSQALLWLGSSVECLGVEGRRMRFLEIELLGSNERLKLVDADPTFAKLRMRKDENEIDNMRRAVDIAEKALAATLPILRPGAQEKEIATELTLQLMSAGSDSELPFSPIVASGECGANPHAFPSDRALQPGDLVTMDWGASFGHYVSDITRTYAIGGAPIHPDLVYAYDLVQSSNQAGLEAVCAGATGQDVDRAARKVIEDAGLGQYFVHRTGHGLGLEAHEDPNMQEGDTLPMEPGMIVTVEPGVYIPGLGGARIEDDVLVTTTGAESLTTVPRDLMTLPV